MRAGHRQIEKVLTTPPPPPNTHTHPHTHTPTHTHPHTHNEINNPPKKTRMFHSFKNTVPDPDLELRGGGGLPPPKKIFRFPWASVWSKNKWGTGGLSSGSATEITLWVSDNRLNKRVGLAELGIKNYMAFERVIYNLYFKRVTSITMKSIFSLVAL